MVKINFIFVLISKNYITGEYVKHNSNAGYVEDVMYLRSTPQAFSHFTFECSNHELIIVDIQGVDNLFTDPQIHTVNGKDYSDGNLGVKGMFQLKKLFTKLYEYQDEN